MKIDVVFVTKCFFRVLRPPGGATSNIFGGAEEQKESKRAVKPTFQSSIFNAEPEPIQTNSKNRPCKSGYHIFFGLVYNPSFVS